MRRSMFGTMLAVFLVSLLPVREAAAVVSCAPCYQAGWTTGCSVCSGASQAAFETINTAISSSENSIIQSLGVLDASASTGFSGLNDTIEASIGQQTSSLKSAFQAMLQSLVGSIDRLPATEKALANNLTGLRAEAIGASSDGCRSADYGASSGMSGRSSLGKSTRWQSGLGVFITDEDEDSESRSEGNGSRAGEIPAITPTQAAAVLNTNPRQTAAFSIKKDLDRLRDKSDNPDATAMELLRPDLLVSESGRVLSEDPGEDDISDSERMDSLISYLNSDQPSTADYLAASASSSVGLKNAAKEKVIAMEMSIPLAVTDKLIRARRPIPSTVGTESYLKAVMGNVSPSDAISADEFVYLTSQYRANDPQWVNKVNVSKEYALRQYAQMEAEALSIKYRRWVFKRDSNLMLAQLLANQLEKER